MKFILMLYSLKNVKSCLPLKNDLRYLFLASVYKMYCHILNYFKTCLALILKSLHKFGLECCGAIKRDCLQLSN